MRAFCNTLGTDAQPESVLIPWHDEHWSALFYQAAGRASETGRAVLLSVTYPMAPCDPLQVFSAGTASGSQECFYWEQATRPCALVGLDRSVVIETSGPQRFSEAATAWHRLREHALIYSEAETRGESNGLLAFGGFTFDPLRPHTTLWQGFPDGLLMVPRLLFAFSSTHATLTLNQLVTAESDCSAISAALQARLVRLSQALSEVASSAPTQEATPRSERLSIESLLPPACWKKQVAHTVAEIRRGTYQKVVLARAIRLINQQDPFDIPTVLHRLRTSYREAHIFAFQRGAQCFIGATPERLVQADHAHLHTIALAGSAPRGQTPDEDQRLASDLLSSAKDRLEHQIVVETIRDALQTLCSEVHVDARPHLRRLKNIQHLETQIAGRLRPGRCLLEALQELHPTPAVGGMPRAEALAAIRSGEDLDRGWYAAPIGWVDAAGNGEFAVGLRSALIRGNVATLFAGGGIMADSQPEREYAETCWKLRAMAGALGWDEKHGQDVI